MNGKTHKIRRRLSTVALTASIAVIAIPAANAGGKHESARVLDPGLNTVEKRGPSGATGFGRPPSQRNLTPTTTGT